jgi:hypothetical protein
LGPSPLAACLVGGRRSNREQFKGAGISPDGDAVVAVGTAGRLQWHGRDLGMASRRVRPLRSSFGGIGGISLRRLSASVCRADRCRCWRLSRGPGGRVVAMARRHPLYATGVPPRLVESVCHAGGVGIEELGSGGEWDVIEALLGLHTAADEACAGLGSATGAMPGPGCSFRAAARELFAETGSLSRAAPGVLRVLPRCRASAGGISIRSLSRHVFVSGPQVEVEWHSTSTTGAASRAAKSTSTASVGR